MSHVSLRGYEYYVIFIDDFSKKTWIFFLKAKNEVFKCFKEFKALVENQTGKKIKVLRSDNGGEYIDSKFVVLILAASWGILPAMDNGRM